MNQTKAIYREIQHFRQIWLWLIIFASASFFWYAFIWRVLIYSIINNRPAHDIIISIICWLLFGIGFPTIFFFTKLITEVRDDGIYIQFFPFQFKFQKISFNELKQYEIRTYKPIREYGGWGIRLGRKGKAYNVSGNLGVQLLFSNGKQLLIGSQQPEKFLQAIQEKCNQ